MYTLCPLPQTVFFLCEKITKNNIACNTRITCQIKHRCYSCQEQIGLNQDGLEPANILQRM